MNVKYKNATFLHEIFFVKKGANKGGKIDRGFQGVFI